MNTGPEDCLSYRDLARQGARVSRAIELQKLNRVRSFTAADSSAGNDSPAEEKALKTDPSVAVELCFRLDSEGYPWVRGTAEVALELLCHRCAETVVYPLQTSFELCIVSDERATAELAETRDLLIVADSTLSMAEVVEDELLLALPERLCQFEPCERMPELAYPLEPDKSDANPADESSPERENPFAVLAGLKPDSRKDEDAQG